MPCLGHCPQLKEYTTLHSTSSGLWVLADVSGANTHPAGSCECLLVLLSDAGLNVAGGTCRMPLSYTSLMSSFGQCMRNQAGLHYAAAIIKPWLQVMHPCTVSKIIQSSLAACYHQQAAAAGKHALQSTARQWTPCCCMLCWSHGGKH
jgi:hypothetical protein